MKSGTQITRRVVVEYTRRYGRVGTLNGRHGGDRPPADDGEPAPGVRAAEPVRADPHRPDQDVEANIAGDQEDGGRRRRRRRR